MTNRWREKNPEQKQIERKNKMKTDNEKTELKNIQRKHRLFLRPELQQ